MRVRFRDSLALLSDRSRKAFQLAHQEAQRLNHSAVGTEHLLLGLAKESLSPGAAALRGVGFDLPWLRRRIEHLHPRGPDDVVLPSALPYSEALESFLERVLAAGETCGLLPLTPEYLLAALIEQPVGQMLQQSRLSLWWLRRKLRYLCRSRLGAACG
jgi:ATP-dependent Clp protease ATP-binding subunit ClpC